MAASEIFGTLLGFFILSFMNKLMSQKIRYKDKKRISILAAEYPEVKLKNEDPARKKENTSKIKKTFFKISANLNKKKFSLFTAKKIPVFFI